MKLYCKEHLWLERRGNDWLLGLTDYAVAMLGEIIWLEFSNSRGCEPGTAIATLESSKIAWEIVSPVTAEVIEWNPRLQDDPGLLNRSPEQQGWFCRLRNVQPEPSVWLPCEAYLNYTEGL